MPERDFDLVFDKLKSEPLEQAVISGMTVRYVGEINGDELRHIDELRRYAEAVRRPEAVLLTTT